MDLEEESGASPRSTSVAVQCASQSSTIIDIIDDRSQEGPPTLKECFMKTRMFNVLKPLMLTFCVAGLVFRVEFGRTGIRKYVTFSHFYSLVCLLFLTFGFLYYLKIFHSGAKLDISFFYGDCNECLQHRKFCSFSMLLYGLLEKIAGILHTMGEGSIGVFISSHFD